MIPYVLSKAILVLLLVSFVSSCYQFREVSCLEAAQDYRKDNLNIVVNKSSGSAYRLELNGFDPISKNSSKFKQVNYTWAQLFIKNIAIGDTVVKKKGELKFYIHKRDTILVFPFECDGKIIE